MNKNRKWVVQSGGSVGPSECNIRYMTLQTACIKRKAGLKKMGQSKIRRTMRIEMRLAFFCIAVQIASLQKASRVLRAIGQVRQLYVCTVAVFLIWVDGDFSVAVYLYFFLLF